MRVLRGPETEEIGAAAFDRLAAPYDHVLMDIGCGDGALPYRLAAAHPHVLCLGLDPHAAGLAEYARRARRKPARGGRENVRYIVAALEEPLPELAGRAGAITINFPWAALLEHVLALGPDEPATLARALNHLAAPHCALQFLLNEVTDLPPLPALDPDGLVHRLTPALSAARFHPQHTAWLAPQARVRSRWGGRLIRGSRRRVVRLRAVRGDPPAPLLALLDDVAS